MTGFDTFIMVDWSGGNDTRPKPRKDAIWAAITHRSTPGVETHYFRNRELVREWLERELHSALNSDRRVLAGFDFPFGYPRGFASALTGSSDPFAVWEWLSQRISDAPESNNRFEVAAEMNAKFPGVGPFWFNAKKRDLPGLPRRGTERQGHGQTEWREVERRTSGTFSCWQLGGAGAVGSQVLMGVPVLNALRKTFGSSLAVWPFEPVETPIVLVEVWPSLISDVIAAEIRPGDIKDSVQVRVLTEALAHQPDEKISRWLSEGDSEEGWIFAADDAAALGASFSKSRTA